MMCYYLNVQFQGQRDYEETEGRYEGSKNDYTKGEEEMMEVEKESIRKSEAERDIGN